MSISQALTSGRPAWTAPPDDFVGRFADDGGPSLAEPIDDLRLLWAAVKGQRIQGVWWPRGRNITREVAALLSAADTYLGAPMTRVSLSPQAWDHQPRRLYAGGRVIRLGWFHSIALCVVPPTWTAAAGRKLFRALGDTAVWPTEPGQLLECGTGVGTAPSR